MKHTLFVLLLLPCFCFAQQTTPASNPGLKIHFDKMVMDVNDEGKSKGNTITTEDVIFLLPDHVKTTERNTLRARGVTISDAHQVLKADKLAYNCNSNTGTLRGHITLSVDGVEKKLGRSAHVALDQNTFKLE